MDLSKISHQEFVQWRPASAAGHDAGEREADLMEAQAQAQAAQAARAMSQEVGA